MISQKERLFYLKLAAWVGYIGFLFLVFVSSFIIKGYTFFIFAEITSLVLGIIAQEIYWKETYGR